MTKMSSDYYIRDLLFLNEWSVISIIRDNIAEGFKVIVDIADCRRASSFKSTLGNIHTQNDS